MLTSSPDGIPVLEPKNLVRRRFVMTLGFVAILGLIAALLFDRGSSDRIIGSGSTFAQPLVERLAVDFQNTRSGDSDWVPGSAGVEYEPVGSLAGIMRLQDPEVDFAITDYPLSDAAIKKMDAVQFPIIVGSISPVYNLGSKVAAPLRFKGSILADIFSGKIKSWSDPAIAADNPGVVLPDIPIRVIHRSDGSGSTLNWTRFLAKTNRAWNEGLGAGTVIKWPTGEAVRGSSQMADAVRKQAGSIGYLETGQAERAGLAIGAVENAAGRFVLASPASVAQAAADMNVGGIGATVSGDPVMLPNAYPVVSASYAFLKRSNNSPVDNERTLRFLNFILEKGAKEARALGYQPLSAAKISEIQKIWSRDLNSKIQSR